MNVPQYLLICRLGKKNAIFTLKVVYTHVKFGRVAKKISTIKSRLKNAIFTQKIVDTYVKFGCVAKKFSTLNSRSKFAILTQKVVYTHVKFGCVAKKILHAKLSVKKCHIFT